MGLVISKVRKGEVREESYTLSSWVIIFNFLYGNIEWLIIIIIIINNSSDNYHQHHHQQYFISRKYVANDKSMIEKIKNSTRQDRLCLVDIASIFHKLIVIFIQIRQQ